MEPRYNPVSELEAAALVYSVGVCMSARVHTAQCGCPSAHTPEGIFVLWGTHCDKAANQVTRPVLSSANCTLLVAPTVEGSDTLQPAHAKPDQAMNGAYCMIATKDQF